MKDFNHPVYAVDWISDGTTICAASDNGKLKLWDVRSMRLIQHYEVSPSAVNSISVHQSGIYLLSGDDEGKVKIFDLRQGRLGWSLFSHKSSVKCVAFN